MCQIQPKNLKKNFPGNLLITQLHYHYQQSTFLRQLLLQSQPARGRYGSPPPGGAALWDKQVLGEKVFKIHALCIFTYEKNKTNP